MTTIGAGIFDRSLTLQKPTQSRTARGGVAESWANVHTDIHASVEPVPADEKMVDAQMRAVRDAIFVIRYRADVVATWRVIYDGNAYDILSITELGRREALRLHAAHGLRTTTA